jgi:MAF protein
MSEGALMLLASNSPRRRELLALGNWSFSVFVPDVDEAERSGEPPGAYVVRLAEAKVRAAAAHSSSEQYVVAADTTVADGEALLGKPANQTEAAGMLKKLRGHSHQVYTGLALIDRRSGQLVQDVCVTEVPMRLYSDAEITQYVRSGDPFDKAGGYAIQHAGFHPVETLRGCYASVMGLPLCHLLRLLRKVGFDRQTDLPDRCQAHLNYACPVSAAILRGEQVG